MWYTVPATKLFKNVVFVVMTFTKRIIHNDLMYLVALFVHGNMFLAGNKALFEMLGKQIKASF